MLILAVEPGEVMPFAAMTLGGIIAVTAIVMGAIRSIASTRMREQTRREVAAYIAEGSMSPDDGERLLKAEPESRRKSGTRCGWSG